MRNRIIKQLNNLYWEYVKAFDDYNTCLMLSLKDKIISIQKKRVIDYISLFTTGQTRVDLSNYFNHECPKQYLFELLTDTRNINELIKRTMNVNRK